jgi:hypothetical protein
VGTSEVFSVARSLTIVLKGTHMLLLLRLLLLFMTKERERGRKCFMLFSADISIPLDRMEKVLDLFSHINIK